MLSAIVSNAGPRVICTDIVDIQAKYNGEFQKLLKEKCERNGYKLDLAKIEFHTMDAQDLAYQENRFDLIFSLNAIEHIPSPLIAIKEIWRVLKPGGMFYASFDPIWSADSGSHFMHYTKEPWLHLIVDDNSYCEAMRKAGAAEWETNEYLTAMNRLPVTFYMKDMKAALEKLFSQHTLTSWSGCVSSEFANHKNHIQAARKTGMSPEELLVRGFRIVALK